jgi:acyl-CoA dehydrogenase
LTNKAPKEEIAVDFSLTEDQLAIRSAVEKLCADFGDDYWLRKDREGGFPHDFHRAIADAGFLGIAMPSDVGGAGLGITEAAILMQTVAESGGGIAAASSIHMNIFGLHRSSSSAPPSSSDAGCRLSSRESTRRASA